MRVTTYFWGMNVPTVLAVLGSRRRESSNRRIVDYILSKYAEIVHIDIYEDVDILPPFDPDIDPAGASLKVREWIEKIHRSDGLLVCTPEYVFSLPGMLKNALEWTVATTVFTDKPVAFIVASASGEYAMDALAIILQTLRGKAVPSAQQLLIKGARSKITAEGLTDAPTAAALNQLMQSLLQEIATTGPAKVEN